jgi:glycosyltransferase involved in cell wall biosynthesis
LSIIESYAHGKPIIGSKIGGIPEILKHDKTGYLFNHGNEAELKEVLLNANSISKDKYQILSKNARDFAENYFNPVKHYKELINIYKEVIKTKK